ncbi:MAG TPA: aconitase/3-isopropylmalate dehydratase large subunit family protein [Bacteroidales bacterium]|nr:aconitase/3-isopropylmalate dehydratase large subunit family protein [Bacteroidales bacterium]HRW85500.1 aconitase/3-isopropylmalate dehydratase large subunit family protein [Bacteroidales bacterium]
MTLIEKILASHSGLPVVIPGQTIDVGIDIRVARDFGGANVVKNIREHGLAVADTEKTLFTFDCNPTGSDQKYAVNQHICRLFARENNITVYDIDSGIGTHLLIDRGYVTPGSTAISTDSHANILGAIGAFGQGMGDMDTTAAWTEGKIWFRVPPSVKMIFSGDLPDDVTAKDFILNLLALWGANSLLGFSIEMYGTCIEKMSLDQRITISSMATEMGAIIILFPPSENIINYCRTRSGKEINPVFADHDAIYEKTIETDVSGFRPMVSRPGEPHDAVNASEMRGKKIDSAFIGSCTNGRMEDMIVTAEILRNRKVAPGVILKIVPATDDVWKESLRNGILEIFKNSGALVSNAGCAGCAAGQVGQNGKGEITISTGNRNFPGKQGKGDVYLASPATVAASAIAGYITTAGNIPSEPSLFSPAAGHDDSITRVNISKKHDDVPSVIEGRVWLIMKDNIDTDMIFHNKYLAITDIKEMGQYTFDNLENHRDFAKKAGPGDIVVTGINFGSGSSRQQAVDCFLSLGIGAIIAGSFGAIYERNAINAALPVVICKTLDEIQLQDGDIIRIDLKNGKITNLANNLSTNSEPFSEVQYKIYRKGGLLN